MTHTGYLIGGYGVTFGALTAYAAWVVARRRALARDVPASAEAEGRDGQWHVDG